MGRRLLAVIAVALASAVVGVAPAWGVSPAPGWMVMSLAEPTNFMPNFETTDYDAPFANPNSYEVVIRNAGSEPTAGPVTITDALPPGVKAAEPHNSYYGGPSGLIAGRVENEHYPGPLFTYPLDEHGSERQVIALRGPELLENPNEVANGHVPSFLPGDERWAFPCSVLAEATVISCTYNHGPVNPGVVLTLDVRVELSPSLKEGDELMNRVTVSGGGAPSASASETNVISSEPAPYGLAALNFDVAGVDGQTDTQAADHPYETTVSYFLNTEADEYSGTFHNTKGSSAQGLGPTRYGPVSHEGRGEGEATKDFLVELPPGLVGDPQVIPKCKQYLVAVNKCPADSQIGVVSDYIINSLNPREPLFDENPIYNVAPEADEPADFRFFETVTPVNISANVSQESNYAVRVAVRNIPRISGIIGVVATFFGTPQTDANVFDLNHVEGREPTAFLENPVDCAAGPLTARVISDSWQHQGSWLATGSPDLQDPNWRAKSTTVYPSMTGCDLLQFQPSVAAVPDTTRADEPSGFSAMLHVPQAPEQFPALATPELKDATVTLPAGMSISPGAADGLEACSDEQIALDSNEAATCPNGSVLGTIKIQTPLLSVPLEGQVFLGAPECDPCTSADAADGKQLRIYIQAAGAGVRVKKEGRVYANPSTGQLTTKFEDNPELPFENLELHFRGGLRAPLSTPQSCGPISATADFEPWSAPITPDAISTSTFDISWNGQGEACPATVPFHPYFSAGTSNPNAGQFTPFTLTFGREDREQDMAQIQVQMPPGLLGTLTGVTLCGQPQASEGTCPQSSLIGTMTVAAGAGPHPFYERGKLYVTGPYEGAPFGLSIVVPTKAGPFNLGNVVVRARINVDPITTALTVTSDPFPQIIDGVPLRLRTTNVTVDRPGFIFNPTNCNKLAITATIASAQGAQAHVSAPFAVSGCAGLPFGPKFEVSTSAHTSRRNGASLDVRVLYPKGAQSNISRVKVELPKQLPARLTTLQKACTAAVFDANPAACPAASIVGVARASTPVLPSELTGPAYFVSNGAEAFPNLIVVLQGYGVRVDLVGDTFISKAGITSSTFNSIPDVQVNSFELYFPEGPGSALAGNGNFCKEQKKLLMPTLFVAQDGAQLKQNTKITVTGCPKATTAKTARAARRRAGRAARARAAEHRRNAHKGGPR